MKSLALLILCCACAALGSVPGTAHQPHLALQVTTGENIPVTCSTVMPGTPVILEYTHSMFGGFVRERYAVTENGTLERQQFLTRNAAAAEYYASDGRIRETTDGYEVESGPFTTTDLVVRVDQRGDHWLTVGHRPVHLARLLPGSTQVHIRVMHDCGTVDDSAN